MTDIRECAPVSLEEARGRRLRAQYYDQQSQQQQQHRADCRFVITMGVIAGVVIGYLLVVYGVF